MEHQIKQRVEALLRERKGKKLWKKAVGVMGAVVVFCTVYALILPAITLSAQPICGQEEHIHTEECYTYPEEEGEEPYLNCGKEAHTHTEECYSSGDESRKESEASETKTASVDEEDLTETQKLDTEDETVKKTEEADTEDETVKKTEETNAEEKKYDCEDEALTVAVVLSGDSQVPVDAKLTAAAITQEDERYETLFRQAQETLGDGLKQLVLYDLSFYTSEGDYLSVEESATVTMTFQQELLFEAADQVKVLHYAEEETAPGVLDGVEVKRDENEELSALTFTTEGFSVYGVAAINTADEEPESIPTAYAVTTETLTLYPGQVYTADIYAHSVDGDSAVVTSSLVVPDYELDGLKLGTDAAFSGDGVPLANALYTFTGDNTDGFKIEHDSVYLNLSSPASYPGKTGEDSFIIKDKGVVEDITREDVFAIYSKPNATHLYFYRDGNNKYQFDRFSTYNKTGCPFLIYKADADGDTTLQEIPGYVKVTSLGEIVNGGQYLIVAEADGVYYVLYPSTNTSNSYSHVAKVTPSALTINANAAGTTTVTAGATEFNITVTDKITVNEGKTVKIQLPVGATVESANTDIATASIDANTGLVTIDGVSAGDTTVTVKIDGRDYTWKITVAPPTSFQLTYGSNIITFSMQDQNGNPLEASVEDISAEAATRYVFAKEGTEEPADIYVKNIVIPEIPGYVYEKAIYDNKNKTVYSVATEGYTDTATGEVPAPNVRFYITEPPEGKEYYTESGELKVTLVYRSKPITTTVSPSGTVINLFDYWVTSEDEGQLNFADSHLDANIEGGINAGHALKFVTASNDNTGTVNRWTGANGGNAGVLQGIVAEKLGEDGYPSLSGNKQMSPSNSMESLAYLFDPAYMGDTAYRNTYSNVGGLLQVDEDGYYYYDSQKNYAEYDADTNQFNLYNDWAVGYDNKESNQGEFFPFDPYDTVNQTTIAANVGDGKSSLNHYFGLTMTTRFIQPTDGIAANGENTAFEFSGDDDVWIFIDDILVADLGGIHNPASVKIDFAEGTVTISKIYGNAGTDITTQFKDIFHDKNVALDNDQKTFEDNTYHTLKFFYLERGGNASNLKLKYNLTTTPVTGIYKVNQYGDPVKGAKFAVYAADDNYAYLADKDSASQYTSEQLSDYTCVLSSEDIPTGSSAKIGDFIDKQGNVLVKALYVGTTNDLGQMVFEDENGAPYALAQLEDMFGGHFILKEIEVPTGYRLVSDEVRLRIGGGNSIGKVLLCENPYTSGTWASPTLQVTATNNLTLFQKYTDEDGNETDIVKSTDDGRIEGTIFAVLLKYTGDRDGNGNATELEKWESWSPVYGTDATGFTIVDVTEEYGGNFISAAIATAQKYVESDNVFTLADGKMKGGLEGLPGDISKYYNMLGDDKGQTEYTVAYYWSQGTGWESINENNTYRINDEGFTRVFGSTIQVPNMTNRLLVQKMDAESNLVNGARFAMYDVIEELNDSTSGKDTTIYYVADDNDGTEVFLETDKDGDNQGRAWLKGGSADSAGTYSVDSTTGIITAEIDSKNYSITPVEVHSTKKQLEEDGTASFTKLATGGYYYVREIYVPEGYHLNPTEVMVRVTDDAVLANAGTADDGVTVARGPGYVAATMHQFASQGQIDNTLTWILAQMRISSVSSSFQGTDKDTYYSEWKYIIANHAKNAEVGENGDVNPDRAAAIATYLMYDTSAANTIFNYTVNEDREAPEPCSSTRRLYTDVGWSYLEIYQDYEHGAPEALKSNSNYEKLVELVDGEEVPLEISNLFSRSVYVQVTDLKAQLEISKTVENAPENTEDAFTFEVSLSNGSEALTGSYPYQVYTTIDDDGKSLDEPKKVEGSSGTITSGGTIVLKHGQVAVIEDLPYGASYTVTEQKSDKTEAADLAKYATKAEQKIVNGNGAEGSITYTFAIGADRAVSGEFYWNVEEDGVYDNVSRVDFTNTYLPELTIKKVKEDSESTVLEGAKFVLTHTGADKKTYYYTEDGAWITVSEGEAKPTLTSNKDGSIVLQIPDGTYTLMEVEAPKGFILTNTPITLTVKDGKITSAAGEDANNSTDSLSVKVDKEGAVLTVPNKVGYELPSTGGAGTAAYRLMGMGVLLLAFLYGLGMKKRRS